MSHAVPARALASLEVDSVEAFVEALDLAAHDVLVEGAGEVDKVGAEGVGEHHTNREQPVVDDRVDDDRDDQPAHYEQRRGDGCELHNLMN